MAGAMAEMNRQLDPNRPVAPGGALFKAPLHRLQLGTNSAGFLNRTGGEGVPAGFTVPPPPLCLCCAGLAHLGRSSAPGFASQTGFRTAWIAIGETVILLTLSLHRY